MNSFVSLLRLTILLSALLVCVIIHDAQAQTKVERQQWKKKHIEKAEWCDMLGEYAIVKEIADSLYLDYANTIREGEFEGMKMRLIHSRALFEMGESIDKLKDNHPYNEYPTLNHQYHLAKSRLLIRNEQYDEAFKELENAKNGGASWEAETLLAKAEIYFNKLHYDKVFTMLDKALAHVEDKKDARSQMTYAKIMVTYARMYKLLAIYPECVKCADKAIEIIKSVNSGNEAGTIYAQAVILKNDALLTNGDNVGIEDLNDDTKRAMNIIVKNNIKDIDMCKELLAKIYFLKYLEQAPNKKQEKERYWKLRLAHLDEIMLSYSMNCQRADSMRERELLYRFHVKAKCDMQNTIRGLEKLFKETDTMKVAWRYDVACDLISAYSNCNTAKLKDFMHKFLEVAIQNVESRFDLLSNAQRLQYLEFYGPTLEALILINNRLKNDEACGVLYDYLLFFKNLMIQKTLEDKLLASGAAVDTYHEVQQKMEANDVAIEFLDYRMSNLMPNYSDTTFHYAALVLRKDWKYPKYVELFSDSLLPNYRYNNELYKGPKGDSLSQMVWNPIKPYLNKGDNVYFSPSGVLHRIAIENLPDEGGLSMPDNYNFIRLSTTNNIARAKSTFSLDSIKSAMLFCNIDYTPTKHYKKLSIGSVDNITRKFTEHHIHHAVKEGREGTREEFTRLKYSTPDIIHLYTHSKVDNKARTTEESMKKSHIVFSGGEVLSGIDIQELDLNGNELIILSSCSSGRGVVTREGVWGLQRALKLAGCQSIIMSMYDVSRNGTEELMTLFYKNLFSGMSPRESLVAAQRDMRNRGADPVYWAGFVILD